MYLKLRKRGAVYHAEGTVAGQRIRESTGCRRRAEAEAYAHRRAQQIIERHAHGVQATYTLAEAALDYMNTGGDPTYLKRPIDYFGPDFRLLDLDNAAIARAARDLYPSAKPATIQRQLVTPLRAVVTLAAEDGKTHFRKFRSFKGDTKRTRWLRPEEAERLLQNCAPHLAPIVATMLGTGARVGEILKAEVPNFFPETGEIWLDQTKTDVPRMLKMPSRSREAILSGSIPASGALFRRPDGNAYVIGERQSPIKTGFYLARDRAGLDADVTPHVLRHTWATWYYAATKDFGGLLDLGGWRSPEMAMRYRKIAPENLVDQLASAGWDFHCLGRQLPRKDVPGALKAGAPSLRVVK